MSSSDWQNKFQTIQERNKHLLESRSFADCKFLVGEDEILLPAHKIILTSASPVFEKMFYGELAEKSDSIFITEVEYKTFYSFLECIYTNRIIVTSFEYAYELYYLGEKYMVENVKNQCLKYLFNNVNEKFVCRTYEFAKFFNLFTLKHKCMNVCIK